jgi:hypothetical protein
MGDQQHELGLHEPEGSAHHRGGGEDGRLPTGVIGKTEAEAVKVTSIRKRSRVRWWVEPWPPAAAAATNDQAFAMAR